MKLLLVLVTLAAAGCQAPQSALPAPSSEARVQPPVVTAPDDAASRPRPSLPSDALARKQAQWIEALINQNEALTARLAMAAMPSIPTPASTPPATPVAAASRRVEISASATTTPTGSTLAPNAEGVIDLIALAAESATDEAVNPFVVRSAASEKAREVTLRIGGTILGASPCAIINDRLVEVGDSVEGLTVERILVSDVLARVGAHQLRLPVSTQTVRVKLAL